ncbi:MAG: hypothetical protein AB7F41_14985 [Methylocystis sp.]|uniref:hypothetical protein n=1 Tax=Methylocystis sp. TaxID=1911079 RepID=UPI003D0CC530
MKQLGSNEWRAVFDGEIEGQPVVALEKIGKQLQFSFARTVAEPLPADIRDLLSDLEAALDRD